MKKYKQILVGIYLIMYYYKYTRVRELFITNIDILRCFWLITMEVKTYPHQLHDVRTYQLQYY